MDVAAWLKENKLDAYDFEEQGYDDVADILALNTEEVNELADSLNMKPGKRKKLLRLIAGTSTGIGSTTVPAASKSGDVLGGNFRLEKKLGEGGMGTAWRADDLHLNRTVAVKIAKSGLGASEDLKLQERLKQEVKAIGACNHDNITDVHSAHFTEPTPFVVFEDLGDTSLRSLIALRSPLLTPCSTRIVAEDLLEALVHMHSKKWIHRDIKPSNIMWLQEGNTLRAKLIDFGIAKNLSEQANLMHTTTGIIIGTPAYMAPMARESPEMISGPSLSH
jgi:serine/threonine protein kinase